MRPSDKGFCPACSETIEPIVDPQCLVCGIPFPSGGISHLCGGCLDELPNYDIARSVFEYGGAVRDAVKRLKYRGEVSVGRSFGRLIFELAAGSSRIKEAEVLAPVPLHPARLRERTFNQCTLMGREFAKLSGIRMDAGHFVRIKPTRPQAGLSRAERADNVRGAFAALPGHGFRDKTVLLVDDVMTTGATVNECARTLKRAGVAKVFVMTACRAV